jgi:hypothetical protein
MVKEVTDAGESLTPGSISNPSGSARILEAV